MVLKNFIIFQSINIVLMSLPNNLQFYKIGSINNIENVKILKEEFKNTNSCKNSM